MSQNKPTASVSNGSGSKDLSCLRCRKKKAKCSKTRPACTRCARSNQPCEYPDAPPNLTDLSQKVLSLYDTLRELEDKFMLQYAAQEQEQPEQMARAGEKRRRRRSSSGYSNPKSPPEDLPSIETLTLINPAKRSRQHSLQRPLQKQDMQPQQQQLKEEEENNDLSFIAQNSLPGNWSMSLTSDGLSLHAVARNMIEFSTFAKDFSHQLRNNDPENKLTKSWEWYEEEPVDEDDDDPLDEDEYLVTVPVYSLSSFLANKSRHDSNGNDTSVHNNHNDTTMTNTTALSPMTSGDGDDTLYNNRIQPALDDIITHLCKTYNLIATDEYPIHLFHIGTLIEQLQPFVLQSTQQQHIRPIQLVCTTTAYAASVLLFRQQQQQPSASTTQLFEDCISYATSALIELVFQRQSVDPLPIVASAALLAWMGKSDMAHIATRVLCGCDAWDDNNSNWQHLAASLLYYEVYSTIFSTPFIQQQQRRRHYEIGEAETWLLRSAKRLINHSPSNSITYHASGLGLETELVYLLKQVFALFYNNNENSDGLGVGVREEESKIKSAGNANIRKVDVDDVLKLVRNIEEWEHQLPKWAQWATTTHDNDNDGCSRWSRLRTHIHLIHNIVKILLFRPFSIEPFGNSSHERHAGREHEEEEEEDGTDKMQTHTRTTFLDLSMAAADRAVTCITRLHDNKNNTATTTTATTKDVDDDEWVQTGYHLAQDVIRRVKEAFPCDDELLLSVREIESRLEALS